MIASALDNMETLGTTQSILPTWENAQRGVREDYASFLQCPFARELWDFYTSYKPQITTSKLFYGFPNNDNQTEIFGNGGNSDYV